MPNLSKSISYLVSIAIFFANSRRCTDNASVHGPYPRLFYVQSIMNLPNWLQNTMLNSLVLLRKAVIRRTTGQYGRSIMQYTRKAENPSG